MHGSKQKARAETHWADELVPAIGPLSPGRVSANFIGRVLRSAVHMGASRPKLLAAIGVEDAHLRHPVGSLPQQVLFHLFGAVEREFDDPAIAMRLAIAAKPGCFSDFGFVATFTPTLGDMLRFIVNIQSYRQNIWSVTLDVATNPAQLCWIVPDHQQELPASCVEFSMASYAHFYRSALPTRLAPQTLYLRHQPRCDEAIYAELLGCPVVFGADETRMVFSRSQFGLPLPNAFPQLQQRVQETYGQAAQWIAQGRKYTAFSYLYLASELNKSPLTLERLAASFGMSERSLRRKLVEEDYPFRQLLEKVRRDLCDLYYMEGCRPMGEIAELLGYSELSAFSRAHKGWHGASPRQLSTDAGGA